MYNDLWGEVNYSFFFFFFFILQKKMANVVEVDFAFDVSDVKKGALHLLSYVRPQWREEDVSVKVCLFCLFIHLLLSLDCYSKCEPLFGTWI